MELKEREEILLTMKEQCDGIVRTFDEALSVAYEPDVQTQYEHFKVAQGAANTLLELFYEDPTRDIDAVMQCVLWFTMAHSDPAEGTKRAIVQIKNNPTLKRIQGKGKRR